MRNCYLSVNWVMVTITTLWLSSKSLVNCACVNRTLSEPLPLSSSESNVNVVKNVVNQVNLKSANITDSQLPPFPQRHNPFFFSDDEEEDDDSVNGFEESSDQEGSGDSDGGSGSPGDSISGNGGINSNFDHNPIDGNKLQIPIDVDSNSLSKDSFTSRGFNRSSTFSNPSSSSSSSSSSSVFLSCSSLTFSSLWIIIGINFLLISSSNCFVDFNTRLRL